MVYLSCKNIYVSSFCLLTYKYLNQTGVFINSYLLTFMRFVYLLTKCYIILHFLTDQPTAEHEMKNDVLLTDTLVPG